MKGVAAAVGAAVAVAAVALIAGRARGATLLPARPPRVPKGSGAELDPVLTPTSIERARTLLAEAFRDVAGAEPTPAEVAMLAAQSALETGNWLKMRQGNFGFVTATPGDTFFRIQGDTTHTYRAYATLEDGAHDFVGLIARRFPKAWALLNSRDVDAYAHELKAGGYYEAPEAAYAAGMRRLYREDAS